MKVLLTGATGYVGKKIADQLIGAGHKVRCLVRNAVRAEELKRLGAEIFLGDATESKTLSGATAECNAVVHLIAVIKEIPRLGITFERVNYQATLNLLAAAKASGVRRFLHMSALGASPTGPTPYFRTKGQAEEAVCKSGLDYTVFRPSFIYGPGDAVYSLIARTLRRSPFGLYPLFGDGRYLSQPVSVHNVAEGFVRALERPASIGKNYDVGGPQPIAFREQIELIGKTIGKPVRFLPLPLPLSRAFVRLAQLFPFSPIDLDRLSMLTSDNICDPRLFAKDLEIDLTLFEIGIAYLRNV